MLHWSVLIVFCSLVATCGHKGPLYLPQDNTHQGNGSPSVLLQNRESAEDL
jgi:predicted small lipoprotein YifL